MSDIASLHRIATKVVLRTGWFTIRQDRVSSQTHDFDYTYVDHPGSVVIAPVDSSHQAFMLRQYRYLTGSVSLEFPAGGIESGEDAETAARRELVEELGIVPSKLDLVGRFFPSNGTSNEEVSVFLARNWETREPRPDNTESLDPTVVRFSEIGELIRTGQITDGLTIIAYQLASASLTGK